MELDAKQGRVLLTRVYAKKGEWGLAEAECVYVEKNYGYVPEFLEFYNAYGYHLLKEKHYEEALEKFKKQIEFAPE